MYTRGLVAALVLSAMAPSALAVEFAAGARAGTLGAGVEGTVGVNERLNLRLPFSMLPYDDDLEEDGIDYEGELDWQTFGLFADYHPFKGSFHLTAGLLSNGNEIRLKASDSTGTEEYELGDEDAVYRSDPGDPLTLRGKMDFDSMAPYVGIGWGNPILGASNWYFKFELGALLQGSPKVGLNASGTAVDSDGNRFDVDGASPEAQEFQTQLEEERATLEDDIEDYDIWPVISFSLGYRF